MTCFKYRLKGQLEVTAKCESPTPTVSGCFYVCAFYICAFLQIVLIAKKENVYIKNWNFPQE